MEHTPGPWKYDKGAEIVKDSNGMLIADMFGENQDT